MSTRAQALAVCLAASLATPVLSAGDTLVIGTGDPSVDIPAVQAAVDAGGVVRLLGTFSFDGPPPPSGRTVVVTHAVTIVGERDPDGSLPTIVGGTRPISVNAPGQSFALQGVRFQNASIAAVEVLAANGVEVSGIVIDQVRPVFSPLIGAPFAGGVFIGFLTNGQVVGDISVTNNTIDIGAAPTDRTEAVVVITVGNAATPAVVRIARNVITHTTAHGIDLRNITGSATVERNTVVTGEIGGQPATLPAGQDRFVDGIRVLGIGQFLVSHNYVEVGYENAAGIRLQGSPTVPITEAIVASNEIVMTIPVGAAPGEESAGIDLRRGGSRNAVLHNRVRGHARAAIALVAERGTWPDQTLLLANNIENFDEVLADVFISAGVTNTTLVGGSGTIDDHGFGTIVQGGYRSLDGEHVHSAEAVGDVVSDGAGGVPLSAQVLPR